MPCEKEKLFCPNLNSSSNRKEIGAGQWLLPIWCLVPSKTLIVDNSLTVEVKDDCDYQTHGLQANHKQMLKAEGLVNLYNFKPDSLKQLWSQMLWKVNFAGVALLFCCGKVDRTYLFTLKVNESLGCNPVHIYSGASTTEQCGTSSWVKIHRIMLLLQHSKSPSTGAWWHGQVMNGYF